MNLHWIDWLIVVGFVIGLTAMAVYLGRYTRSVEDFLVANRCAGRYLLSVSQGMSAYGAISFLALFEMYYIAGFVAAWWQMLTLPLGLFVSLSGWIIYRYRETRAMTMAEFFEMRYSRRFRIFCGVLAWVCGVVNMGIFPAVTARFFIYFCGLPEHFEVMGWEFSTFVLIMMAELITALVYTFLGGMIVVAITDFVQGIFCNVGFLIILIVLVLYFDWGQILVALQSAPDDASLVHPFKTSQARDFNVPFFLMNAFFTFYALRAWQGSQGYNAAAKDAHEAKMANILGLWRGLVLTLLVMLIPICAYTLMHHTDFTAEAQMVNQTLSQIPNEQIQKQVLVPVVLAQVLPVGVAGLFTAIMIAAMLSTDDTYLHSWGSIFIQDVVLPFRRRAFTSKQHMLLLRISCVFVAVVVFIFSLYFRQVDYIYMFQVMTGAIYLGGAGAVIVGGLYWKHGATAGAWGAMLVGAVLAGGGLLIQQFWTIIVPSLNDMFPDSAYLAAHSDEFPYSGMQINFFAVVSAITTYIILSLLSRWLFRTPPHDMQKLLHRGPHAIKGEHRGEQTVPPTGLKAILPSKEFTITDKIIYYGLLVWICAWYIFFILVTGYNLVWDTDDTWWQGLWRFKVWLYLSVGAATTIWFFVGGLADLKYIIKALKKAALSTDNGARANNT